MIKSVEKTGRTVEEAIDLALQELKVDKDKVEIKIKDEGNKGIFGLIGSKQAHVMVSIKENGSKVEKFFKNVFEKMNLAVDIEIEENERNIVVNLKGENMGLLIGKRGETLDALQCLANIVANKESTTYKKVLIDTENYRQKREETLIRLANKVAERVINQQRSVTLEPMTSYERRIIHSALQQNNEVKTYSIDEDPYRKVVITLK